MTELSADSNDDRMDKLLEFQDITGMADMADSRDILNRHNWNLEEAVNSFFSEPRDENIYDNTLIHPLEVPDTRNHSFIEMVYRIFRIFLPFETTPSNNNNINDQRVQGYYRQMIFKFFAFPFRFLYYAFIAFYQFLSSLVPIFGNTNPLRIAIRSDPEADISNFIYSFEQEYGHNHPAFCKSSYNQAIRDAKSSGKFLFTYFHDFRSENCGIFCREILCMPRIVEYFKSSHHNWILWACDINSGEGQNVLHHLEGGGDPRSIRRNPYSHSIYTLNRIPSQSRFNPQDSNSLPYIIIHALKYPDPFIDGPLGYDDHDDDLNNFLNSYFQRSPNGSLNTPPDERDVSQLRMTVVYRIKGLETLKSLITTTVANNSSHHDDRVLLEPESFIDKLRLITNSYSEGNALIHQEKTRRERTINLRKQQEEALEESLQADKLKIQAKRDERAATHKKEMRNKFLKAKQIYFRQAIGELSERLSSDMSDRSEVLDKTGQPSVKIMIKLPNGKRLEKLFLVESPIQDLYNYVFCNITSLSPFKGISTPNPEHVNQHTKPAKSISPDTHKKASSSQQSKSSATNRKADEEFGNSSSSLSSFSSYNHFKLVTHYPRRNLPCDLHADDKAFLVMRVKELLLEHHEGNDEGFREILLEHLTPFPNIADEFHWLISDESSNSHISSPLITHQELNCNSSDLTFKDCDLTQTTVVYVQDV